MSLKPSPCLVQTSFILLPCLGQEIYFHVPNSLCFAFRIKQFSIHCIHGITQLASQKTEDVLEKSFGNTNVETSVEGSSPTFTLF